MKPIRTQPSAPPDSLENWRRRRLIAAGFDAPLAAWVTDSGIDLHELLLRAARFEVSPRRHTFAHLRGGDHDDLAVPGVRAHLVGCPACAEDHDSLLEYVRHGGDDTRQPDLTVLSPRR